MRLTPEELARLDADAAAGRMPPVPPPLARIEDVPTVVALIRYRAARLKIHCEKICPMTVGTDAG